MDYNHKDPVMEALLRIESKQEQILENQQAMDEEIKEIRKECRKTAALYGGLGGMTVAAGFELIKIKLGIGGN